MAGIALPSALPEEQEPGWIRCLFLPAVQMGVQAAEGVGVASETGLAEERAPAVSEAAPEAAPAVEPLSENEVAVEMQEIETAAPSCEGWRQVKRLLRKSLLLAWLSAFGLFGVWVKGR